MYLLTIPTLSYLKCLLELSPIFHCLVFFLLLGCRNCSFTLESVLSNLDLISRPKYHLPAITTSPFHRRLTLWTHSELKHFPKSTFSIFALLVNDSNNYSINQLRNLVFCLDFSFFITSDLKPGKILNISLYISQVCYLKYFIVTDFIEAHILV